MWRIHRIQHLGHLVLYWSLVAPTVQLDSIAFTMLLVLYLVSTCYELVHCIHYFHLHYSQFDMDLISYHCAVYALV